MRVPASGTHAHTCTPETLKQGSHLSEAGWLLSEPAAPAPEEGCKDRVPTTSSGQILIPAGQEDTRPPTDVVGTIWNGLSRN